MKASPEVAAHLLAIGKKRLGLDGYARIYASLREGPAGTVELAARNKTSTLTILAVMRHLLRCKLVHRCRWFRPAAHARMVPVWAFGDGPDVSMPMYEERTRRPRRAPSMLILLTTVLDLLKDEPLTHAEIAEELAMSVDSSYRIMQTIRRRKLAYIASWDKPAVGTPIPEFKAGNRKNAPRPAKVGARYFIDVRERKTQQAFMRAQVAPAEALAEAV